jgi:hypothetical protein
VPSGAPALHDVADVRGAWAAETYYLHDGSVHEVRGPSSSPNATGQCCSSSWTATVRP